jgi:hypothetical protein
MISILYAILTGVVLLSLVIAIIAMISVGVVLAVNELINPYYEIKEKIKGKHGRSLSE